MSKPLYPRIIDEYRRLARMYLRRFLTRDELTRDPRLNYFLFYLCALDIVLNGEVQYLPLIGTVSRSILPPITRVRRCYR